MCIRDRCRKKLARRDGVPPYCVMHNRSLRAMAVSKPGTLEELGGVPGVGEAKLARFGGDLLAVIHSHGCAFF